MILAIIEKNLKFVEQTGHALILAQKEICEELHLVFVDQTEQDIHSRIIVLIHVVLGSG